MDRQIIEISNNGFFLSLYRGFLVIENEKKQKQEIPLDNILSLILSADNTVISKNIVNAVIEQGGNIIFCDKKYLPSTIAVPYNPLFTRLSTNIYCKFLSLGEVIRASLTKSIVTAPLLNFFTFAKHLSLSVYCFHSSGVSSSKISPCWTDQIIFPPSFFH